jgi:HD-GYP domain-containing protein (c-di-GMP phosphodiesterase class II)
MDNSPSKVIDISQLRKGMFVQLDLGWMSHPFAVGSFKVSTDEQIQTLRGLGLSEVRYIPEKSDPAFGSEEGTMDSLEAALEQDDPVARERSEQLGAQCYSLGLCEQEFADAVKCYSSIRHQAQPAPACAFQESTSLVSRWVRELRGAGESVIRVLESPPIDSEALHPINTVVLALLLGHALDMGAAELADLGLAALLHNMGKLELPERLRFPDPGFAPDELHVYQSYVAHSLALAERMGLPARALQGITQHQELLDGSGFPLSLTGDKLSQQGKVLALVNRFDLLCNPGPNTPALTPHEALSLIFAQMKAKFDAAVLGGFIRMMGVYPPGSVVQLVNDRFAMVVSVNSLRPLRPAVLVFDTRVPREQALVLDLERMPDLGIRRSLKPALLPPAAREYLRPPSRICYFFERTVRPRH